MGKTLGLDLGSNSLGWAVLDDAAGDILDKGVVVFPEGIDAANDSLDTPAAIRRSKRMLRRMKFRRKLRKWGLLKVLIGAGMCPLTLAELDTWKKTGKYPLANRAFIDWLKATDASNPYCDRNAAANGPVPPLTLGRALYHICQRRGFKSSRKDAAGAATDEKTGEVKADDKELGAVKSSIRQLSDDIAASGAKTLGQYFYKCLEAEKNSLVKTRIRCRYTGRIEHYEHEFAVIMDAQGYAPDNALRKKIHGEIFYQRPLRSQKHLVGKCPLEPKSPRAQISHPLVEEFRMLSFVNNLSFDGENGERVALTPEDRALVRSAFEKTVGDTIKFAAITKLFKKDPRFKEQGFAFHYYHDDESIPNCAMRNRLKKGFGDVAYDEQKVFDALTFFDDDEKLKAWFKKQYPALDDAAVEKLVKIHPREGNANYSLKAIRKILPFLRKGFELSYAKLLAKLPDFIPDFAAHEEEIIRHLDEIKFQYHEEKRRLADDASYRRGEKVRPLYDRYQDYLLTNWNLQPAQWNKLYLRGENPYEKNATRIPAVQLGMIRNPLVQRSMTTLRRLVNYLRDHGKIDADTTIRIELARGVNSFAERKAWQEWQKKRQALRDAARTELAKVGVAATEDAIDRYVLWTEQGHVCLYTGDSISLQDLVQGNRYDIEHTLPRSLSGDDSLANKTICEAAYNRQTKLGRVPRDCPNWHEIDTRLRPWRETLERLEKDVRNQMQASRRSTDPAARSRARIKALTTRFERDYWRDKLRRFDMEADKLMVKAGELGGFKRRQLVDTGIMCSHAVELLKSVYDKVYSVNGTATAFARKAWGIQGDEAKDRSDHTHHAKDAMVIAALSPTRFTDICTALKDDGRLDCRRPCDVCPSPWPDFAERVRQACGEILVKHVLRQTTLRQSSKRTVVAKVHAPKGDPNGKRVKAVLGQGDTVRGALHKDTFYGCIQKLDAESGKMEKVFVVRKPLVGPLVAAKAIAPKIVDPVIRDIVTKRLDELAASGVKNVAAGDIKMPSGVPVNRVRIQAQTTNPSALRDHAIPSSHDYKTPYYVTSAEGSNFRLGLFCKDGKSFVKPDNSLTWAQNHKKVDYQPLDAQDGFIGYVMPGSMALTYHEGHPEELKTLAPAELRKRLYKVVKFRDDGRVTFRLHTEARASVVLEGALAEAGKNKKGQSKIDFENPHELLCLSPRSYSPQILFEGIHFKMMLNGSIKFL